MTAEIEVDVQEPAELIIAHELLNDPYRREEPVILADHQCQAKALRQVDRFFGFGYRGAEGLLDQDVFAGVQAGFDHRDVRRQVRGHQERFGGHIVQGGAQRSKTPVCVDQAQFLYLRQSRSPGVDTPGQFGIGNSRENPGGPILAPHAHAYLQYADHSSMSSLFRGARGVRAAPPTTTKGG